MTRTLILLLITLSFTTCVSIIEFDTLDERELVIFGKFTNSEMHDQSISIKRTDLNTTAGLSIDDASVTVTDEFGRIFPYRYAEAKERYLPIEPLVGVAGTSYQASVTVNNQTYRSSWQKMPLVGARDSTYFQVERITVITDVGAEIQRYVVKIFTDSQLDFSEEPIYMKWDVEQVYIHQEIALPGASFPFYSPRNCYIYDEYIARNILLFDGAVVNTSSIQGQEVAEIPVDNSFSVLRGFGIIQSSISREALEYWQRVESVSNRVGSIFEIPPAPIPGNFVNIDNPEDMPLGFFEVAKVDTSGTFVTSGDIPVTLGLNGDFVNCNFAAGQFNGIPINCFPCLEARGVAEACYNCLSLPNSSLVRPSYLD